MNIFKNKQVMTGISVAIGVIIGVIASISGFDMIISGILAVLAGTAARQIGNRIGR